MSIPVLATGWVVGAIFHTTADDARDHDDQRATGRW